MIAPTLGFIGLAILSVMTAVNLPLLVGGSGTLAAIIGVLLVGAFLGGAAVAVLRPHAGHQDDTPGSVTDAHTDKEIAR